MEKKTKDFIFSIVLCALSIYVMVEGVAIYRRVALPPYKITQFSLSPGFLPVILGGVLLLCSLLLFIQSIAGGQGFVGSIKARCIDIGKWFGPALHDKDMYYTIGGVLIMGIYTFVLMTFLPFWIASLLFLVGIMFYLHAQKWWKILLISAGAVGLIVLLFQVVFKAALP